MWLSSSRALVRGMMGRWTNVMRGALSFAITTGFGSLQKEGAVE